MTEGWPDQVVSSTEHHMNNAVMERADDQIQWYDRKSHACRKWYKSLKTMTIVNASLIPVVAGSTHGNASSLIAGILGGLVAMIEGIQQLNQFHANWISYRSISESLKHEKYLYLALAGPYTESTHPSVLFAERVESLVSQENAKWSSMQKPSQA